LPTTVTCVSFTVLLRGCPPGPAGTGAVPAQRGP
jgi:hypothetical protein